MSQTPGSGGLLAATKNSAATLLASGRTRLELLGNEIKEEKLRAVRILLLAAVLAISLMVGTLLLVGLLTIVFWDNRVPLLCGLTGFFLLLAGFSYAALRRSMRTGTGIFSASIAALGEDLGQLKGASGNEPGNH